VICPGGIVAKERLVESVACALIAHVCYPDGVNGRGLYEGGPERFVALLININMVVCVSFRGGEGFTLGKPFPCAAMMVTGSWVEFRGVRGRYSLTARRRTAASCFAPCGNWRM
jgi:hypothetical protein